MLRRFSLYGFLKNQRYFEPFLWLAFLDMGLSFAWIGGLIAFRQVAQNLMELPTGAIADLWGRRKCMMFSFASYIVSFAIMGSVGVAAQHDYIGMNALIPLLFIAMVFYAVGDAFRTGTHKAMIFTWLRKHGRENERTTVYGYTRSWSKIGSAVSVVLAGVFVFVTRSYVYVFFFSIPPYLLNVINFAGYPSEVDGAVGDKRSLAEVFHHLKQALRTSVRQTDIRRLLFESMGFGGFFAASKDYLQPILKAAALPLTAALFAGALGHEEQRVVILVVPVYFALFLVSAFASRNAHRLVGARGNEDRAARFLWGLFALVLATLTPIMYFGAYWVTQSLMILGFAGLYVIQNLWRPVLMSRFDIHSQEGAGATVLSIESQAKSGATALLAPLLGFAVDSAAAHHVGQTAFWPVTAVGALVASLFFVTTKPGSVRRAGEL